MHECRVVIRVGGLQIGALFEQLLNGRLVRAANGLRQIPLQISGGENTGILSLFGVHRNLADSTSYAKTANVGGCIRICEPARYRSP